MVSTRACNRAARKRTSGEVSNDAISGGVKTRNQLNVKTNNNNNNNIIDSEPSLLPPKTKRQRTSSSSSSGTATSKAKAKATTTAQSKKARALKPVAANVNKQKKTSAKATTTKAKAKTATKAKATTKTKATARKSSSSSSSSNEKKSLKKKAGTKIVPSKSKSNDKSSSETAFVKRARRRSKSIGTVKEENAATTTSNVSRSLSSFSAQWLSGGSSSQRLKLSGGQKGVEPDDIDERDKNDPNSVTDYVEDMYEHFFRKEEGTSVNRCYMGRPVHGVNHGVGKLQPHINENMRCILVDWLIEVHYKFKLFPETLYLTANILDRFLSETDESVTKRDLQLVGVTALLISAKYEEMFVPELRDLTYICDGAYTEAKILRMEENILRTLEYNVTVPTPHTFLVRFLKAAHACKLTQQIANFVLDGTLLSLEHLTCLLRPSQMAAAAVMIARRAIGRLNWSPTLVAYSQYDEEEVIRYARMVLKAKSKLDKNKELMALQKKYSKNKYGKVSHYKFAPIKDPIYDY